MRSANMPNAMRRSAHGYSEKGEHRIERVLKAVGAKDVATYWKLNAGRSAMRLDALEAWDAANLDVVLCPPHATAALRHGDSADFSAAGSYAMRYNLLNFPAGVVPVTKARADDGVRANRIASNTSLPAWRKGHRASNRCSMWTPSRNTKFSPP